VLNQDAITSINQPLSVAELANTLHRMNKNASPGVFGLDVSTLKLLF